MKGSIVRMGKTHGPGSGEQKKHSGAGILVLVLPDNIKSSNSDLKSLSSFILRIGLKTHLLL